MWPLKQDATAGFEDGARGWETSNIRDAALEVSKGEGTDFPLEPLEGVWPC